MRRTLVIDPTRVELYLHDLARFGAYGDTGVWRTVYSPEWQAAQNQYAAWCREAGLDVHSDAVGNVWGAVQGTDGGASIVSGSHIDSQRPGGRFDGALGAVGALIAIRALVEQYGQPRRTLEALALCEEESSRFAAANFWASRAITGRTDPDEPNTIQDYEGVTMADAMRFVGLDPSKIREAKRDDIETFIELHIEQGPILEHAGVPVGIVTGITGIRHLVVEVAGRANHAGAFPMDLRRDPMPAVAEIISQVIDVAQTMGRPAVTTVGRLTVEPNLAAAVPEKVTFTIDARHPDVAGRRTLYDRHAQIIGDVSARLERDIMTTVVMDQPPKPCDEGLVALIEKVAHDLEIPAMHMHSGAGHDSQIMAGISRAAMIFVRSKDGRSHTPDEFTSTEDAVAGIQILAETLHRLAY